MCTFDPSVYPIPTPFGKHTNDCVKDSRLPVSAIVLNIVSTIYSATENLNKYYRCLIPGITLVRGGSISIIEKYIRIWEHA